MGTAEGGGVSTRASGETAFTLSMRPLGSSCGMVIGASMAISEKVPIGTTTLYT